MVKPGDRFNGKINIRKSREHEGSVVTQSMHLKRWLTACVLGPVLIGTLLSGLSAVFYTLILIASIFSHREYLNLAFPHKDQTVIRAFGLIMGLAVIGLPIFLPSLDRGFQLACLTVFSFLFFLLLKKDNNQSFIDSGRFILGLFYAPLLLSLFIPVWRQNNGDLWILFALGVIFMSDTGAYYAGKTFGKTKLYPHVSPKKTIEGSLGGLAAGLLFALIFSMFALPFVSWWSCLAAAVILNVLGQAGDLFESLLKRAVGVKDSGKSLPGHGGLLDRIDGVLFASPPLFTYVMYFQSV